MKYYLIAGEASGDLHASNLMKALKQIDPAADFRFWGGDLMQEEGGTPVKHYKELAFMGFVEVLFNLWTIRGLIYGSPNGQKNKVMRPITIFPLKFGPGRKTGSPP